MERTIQVRHINFQLKSKFDDFTKRLEDSLGKLDRTVLAKLPDNPGIAEEELKNMGGLENLILFNIENHGELLSITGISKKAKLYILGNPLIAADMTSVDIRAALYVPLRLLVYVAEDDKTYVEYDLPSTLVSQFNRNSITQVGEMLDTKMTNLIEVVDRNEKYRLADQVF